VKSEAEIREAIAALDDLMKRPVSMKEGTALSMTRDCLAWTIGLPPMVEYPPIEATVNNARRRSSQRN